MADFWTRNKNNGAQDFDFDIDNSYYDDIDGARKSSGFDSSDIYGSEFDIPSEDVQVVTPEPEEEPEEEKLYKVLYAPEDCHASIEIVESLMEGRIVVINISNLDRENFLRLFDYVMGALKVLGGEFKRFGKKVAVLYPAGVDTDIALEDVEDEPYEYEEETYEEDDNE